MPIDHIRLSQRAKDQLVKLKRDTGIMQWNVLCRWAFCVSLAEPSTPPDAQIPADSNVEMDWKTFAGEYADVYWALLQERCQKDTRQTDAHSVNKCFRLHLHRGIGYLTTPGVVDSIGALFEVPVLSR
jgi:DNA sulfur modification protein DndE